MLHELGTGGMGSVYLAYDPNLDREIALKLVQVQPADRERAAREGRSLARLNHPNVVRVFDVGRQDNRVFIAMELLKGPTLSVWLRQERPTWRGILDVFIGCGRGLVAAHLAGIVHCDFKPSNVVFDPELRPKIVDFGIALEHDATSLDDDTDTSGTHRISVVVSRAKGTPLYMPPEQYRAGRVTEAADQFAFCVALYDALSGRHPFSDSRDRTDVARAVIRGTVRPMEVAGLPTRVVDAVMRGLSRRPEKRWPTMASLVRELHGARQRRRRSATAAGGLIIAAIGLGLAGESEVAAPCMTAQERAVAFYGEGGREALGSALNDLDRTHAGLPPAVGEGIDARVTLWADAREALCIATREAIDAGDTDPYVDRRACLESVRRRLELAVDLLVDGGDRVRSRAADLVESLPSAKVCARARPRTDAVAPLDPELQLAIDGVHLKLERAKGELAIGRVPAARTMAHACLAEAESLDHPPLLVAALQVLGQSYASAGMGAQAVPLLERAAWLALSIGDKERAATVMLGLVSPGRSIDRVDEALAWARRAEALMLESTDVQQSVRLQTAVSRVLSEAGRLDEALTAALTAVERCERKCDGSGAVLGQALRQLAGVRYKLDDFDAAEVAARRSLEHVRRSLGARHPSTGASVGLLSSILAGQGRLQEALPLANDALEIAELAYGPRSRFAAGKRSNLAGQLRELGRFAEAKAQVEQAIEIWNEGGYFDSSVYGYERLAGVLLEQEEPDAPGARRAAEQAWELLSATPSGVHPLRGPIARTLGEIDAAAGRSESARRWLGEALSAGLQSDDARESVEAELASLASERR